MLTVNDVKTSEHIKKLIFAWDPDFVKLTPEERKRVEDADAEFKRNEYISAEEFWK